MRNEKINSSTAPSVSAIRAGGFLPAGCSLKKHALAYWLGRAEKRNTMADRNQTCR